MRSKNQVSKINGSISGAVDSAFLPAVPAWPRRPGGRRARRTGGATETSPPRSACTPADWSSARARLGEACWRAGADLRSLRGPRPWFPAGVVLTLRRGWPDGPLGGCVPMRCVGRSLGSVWRLSVLQRLCRWPIPFQEGPTSRPGTQNGPNVKTQTRAHQAPRLQHLPVCLCFKNII